MWGHFTAPLIPKWALIINVAGAGVWLFFVLSGFLITTLLLADQRTPGATLRRFYVRRALRIFPIYYFAIAVGLALDQDGFRSILLWLLTFTTNFGILDGHNSGHAGHFWSLAVEEQFYLAWPLLLILLRRHSWMLLCAVIPVSMLYKVIIYGAGIYPVGGVAPLSCADALSVGALVAIACDRFGAVLTERWLRMMLPISLPVAILFTSYHDPLAQALTGVGAAAFFAWLIIMAVRDGPDGSSWGGGLLLALGKISYGVYVYHNIIFGLVRDSLDNSWWGVALMVAMTIFAALLSFHLLENPLRRIGYKFALQRPLATDLP
jgi:peptidoglycan/LPS O-acetylase OafA/YrhL